MTINRIIKTTILILLYFFVYVLGVYSGVKLMVSWENTETPVSNNRMYMYNELMLKDCLIELRDLKEVK